MIVRKQGLKPTLLHRNEGGDHVGVVAVILRPVVLAPEEELELRGEISDLRSLSNTEVVWVPVGTRCLPRQPGRPPSRRIRPGTFPKLASSD